MYSICKLRRWKTFTWQPIFSLDSSCFLLSLRNISSVPWKVWESYLTANQNHISVSFELKGPKVLEILYFRSRSINTLRQFQLETHKGKLLDVFSWLRNSNIFFLFRLHGMLCSDYTACFVLPGCNFLEPTKGNSKSSDIHDVKQLLA